MAVAVAERTQRALARLSAGEPRALADAVGLPDARPESTGLDARTCALVRIATLVADGGPTAAYTRRVADALREGATPEDVLGVLRAVAAHVGGTRVVAAAPAIMDALGLAQPAPAPIGGGKPR